MVKRPVLKNSENGCFTAVDLTIPIVFVKKGLKTVEVIEV